MTMEALKKTALQQTDTEAAMAMQKARQKLLVRVKKTA